MSKAVDVKVTTLISRKKPAAEILERIHGVLEGDDFPALPIRCLTAAVLVWGKSSPGWVRH